MDIRELFEQRKRELYGYDSDDITLENFGDITGEDDDEFFGDITMENDEADMEEYFNSDELRQIDVEASMIDDPDEYIDNVIEEASVDMIELVGESYINDLVLEDALLGCNSIEELEAVEESVKETAVNFKNKAIARVKALWGKFSAWIKNLASSLKNQFVSGSKLISKYSAELSKAYNDRKDKIKVKSYVYKKPTGDPCADIVIAVKNKESELTGAETLEKNKANIRSAYAKGALSAEGSGKKDIRSIMASKIRNDEKKEILLSQITLDVITYFAGVDKEAIKAIKTMDKEQKNFFKTRIDTIKAQDVEEPAATSSKDDDEDEKATKTENKSSKKDGKAKIAAQVTIAKQGSAILSMGLKAYIAELKGANRACTAIVRKLLNRATAGGDMESKLHKKVKKRL